MRAEQRCCREQADVAGFVIAERQWINAKVHVEAILNKAMTDFNAYIDQIRNGTPLAELEPIQIAARPPAPVVPEMPDWVAKRRLLHQVQQLQQHQQQQQLQQHQQLLQQQQQQLQQQQLAQLHHQGNPLYYRGSQPPCQNADFLPISSQSAAHSQTGSEMTEQQLQREGMASAGVIQMASSDKPRTQALYDNIALHVPDIDRMEILEAIKKAREGLPSNSFRGLGMEGTVTLVVDTLHDMRRSRVQSPSGLYRVQVQPQEVRLIGVETERKTPEPVPREKRRQRTTALETVKTAAETVPFFETPKDAMCSICHADIRPGPNLRCVVCKTVFDRHCLEKWLKEKKTCPVCSRHMLLDEEFPAL